MKSSLSVAREVWSEFLEQFEQSDAYTGMTLMAGILEQGWDAEPEDPGGVAHLHSMLFGCLDALYAGIGRALGAAIVAGERDVAALLRIRNACYSDIGTRFPPIAALLVHRAVVEYGRVVIGGVFPSGTFHDFVERQHLHTSEAGQVFSALIEHRVPPGSSPADILEAFGDAGAMLSPFLDTLVEQYDNDMAPDDEIEEGFGYIDAEEAEIFAALWRVHGAHSAQTDLTQWAAFGLDLPEHQRAFLVEHSTPAMGIAIAMFVGQGVGAAQAVAKSVRYSLIHAFLREHQETLLAENLLRDFEADGVFTLDSVLEEALCIMPLDLGHHAPIESFGLQEILRFRLRLLEEDL